MNITRAKTGDTKRGPAEYFTGVVLIDDVTQAPYASDVRVAIVRFEPGARTAWHTHPHGQTLQILSGVGRVQRADATGKAAAWQEHVTDGEYAGA